MPNKNTKPTAAIEMVATDSLLVDSDLECRELHEDADELALLRRSMKKHGFDPSQPILVVEGEVVDEEGAETTEKALFVVDGQHRLHIASELGIKEVPVVRRAIEDADAKFTGFVRNASSIPMSFGEECEAVLERAAAIKAETGKKASVKRLTQEFCKSNIWVQNRLKFADLEQEVRDAFNANQIGVAHINVFCMGKMKTRDEQLALLKKALRTPGHQFFTNNGADADEIKVKKAKTAFSKLTESEVEEVSKLRSVKAVVNNAQKMLDEAAKAAKAVEAILTEREEFATNAAYEDGTLDAKDAAKLAKIDDRMNAAACKAAKMEGRSESLLWILRVPGTETTTNIAKTLKALSK